MVRMASEREASPIPESTILKTVNVPTVEIELLEVGSGARVGTRHLVVFE